MTTPRKTSAPTRFVKVVKTYFAPKNIFTKEDRNFHLNWWQILCLIAGSVLGCWLMDYLGRFDLARPVLATIGSLFIAMRLRWQLRDRVWFWAIILIYLANATVLTFALTWSTKGPSRPIIGGFMTISVYFLFVVFHAFERRDNPASHTSKISSPEKPT